MKTVYCVSTKGAKRGFLLAFLEAYWHILAVGRPWAPWTLSEEHGR